MHAHGQSVGLRLLLSLFGWIWLKCNRIREKTTYHNGHTQTPTGPALRLLAALVRLGRHLPGLWHLVALLHQQNLLGYALEHLAVLAPCCTCEIHSRGHGAVSCSCTRPGNALCVPACVPVCASVLRLEMWGEPFAFYKWHCHQNLRTHFFADCKMLRTV